MAVNRITITIDGEVIYRNTPVEPISFDVTSSGLTLYAEVDDWEYSGTGTFAGFSTTEGATTPDEGYAVGDSGSFDLGTDNILYSVATLARTAKEIFEDNMTTLADAINTKASSSGTKTIQELITTVNSISPAKEQQTKTVSLDMASGDQVITPDTNKVLSQVTVTKPATLVAANIKTGVTIGGVQGSFTSDGTAVAGDILNGKTAYVNGSKITGNIQSQAATTYNTSSSDQTIASGKYLSGDQTIRGVTTSNIVAANVVNGATVKVGDANDDDRILLVNGTAPSEDDMYTEMNTTAYGTPRYEVTITFQNSRSTEDWLGTTIYDDYDDDYQASGNIIGTMSSADGTVNVITTTGKICINSVANSGFVSNWGTSTCTGGVQQDSHHGSDPDNLLDLYTVTASGTITISGIDWDD